MINRASTIRNTSIPAVSMMAMASRSGIVAATAVRCNVRPIHTISTVTPAPSTAHTAASFSTSSRTTSAVRAPSRSTVLSTYRSIRRALFQTFYTASQYAGYDELARDSEAIAGVSPGAAYRKEAFANPLNQSHLAFAQKRAPRWFQQLAQTYRTNRSLKDPAQMAKAQREAEQYLSLLQSNMEHSRYLLEGGWGLRRNQVQQLTNVAHKVGLQMPKESTPLVWVPAGAKHQKARDAVTQKHDKFVK